MHTQPDLSSSPTPDGAREAGGAQVAPVAGEEPAEPVASEAGAGAGAAELARIDQALAVLARHAELDAERAAARERVIDRQHAEIERLRSAERSGVLRPVVTDLCRLRNDLRRQAATLPAELSRARVVTLLESFADVVADALERCGVVVLATAPGTPFVPGRQQVAGTVEVDDPVSDSTIDAVVHDGYAEIDGGKVVLPTRVTLRRATGAAGSPPRTEEIGEKEDIGE